MIDKAKPPGKEIAGKKEMTTKTPRTFAGMIFYIDITIRSGSSEYRSGGRVLRPDTS